MYALRKTVGAFSAGTKVERYSGMHTGELVKVRTVAKIQKVRHRSFFDQADRQHHSVENAGKADYVEMEVPADMLVKLRDRNRG